MNILKLALLGILRIAFLGSLNGALCVYALFLSDAAVTSAAPEGNGHVGGTAPYGAPKGNSNATIG
jgi:hypothetical protein